MESCLPGRPSLRNSPGGGRGQIPGAADNGEALVREVPGAGDTDALQRHRQPHILRFRDTLPLERKSGRLMVICALSCWTLQCVLLFLRALPTKTNAWTCNAAPIHPHRLLCHKQ